MNSQRRFDTVLRPVVMGTCQYEVVALAWKNGPLPSISNLCWRYRILAPVILAGLAVHLYRRPDKIIEAIEAVTHPAGTIDP